jgi:hypothetical protein
MLTGNSSLQQGGPGSASTSSIKSQMLRQMESSKDYRHGFIEESIRSRIIGPIAALRSERGWDLKKFASNIGPNGKKLSWAYRLEDPNSSPPTIPTLLEVAETFDVGLDVRFRSFSELLNDASTMTPVSFLVRSFGSELKSGAFSRPVRRRRSRRKVQGVSVEPHSIVQKEAGSPLALSGNLQNGTKEAPALRGNAPGSDTYFITGNTDRIQCSVRAPARGRGGRLGSRPPEELGFRRRASNAR